MNALDVIIQNECKLELESFGYKFSDDLHIHMCPEGFPILYTEATTEVKRSAESKWEYAYHMVYVPLDYLALLNQVKRQKK